MIYIYIYIYIRRACVFFRHSVIRGRDHLHILVIRGRDHLAITRWSRPLITRMCRWSRPLITRRNGCGPSTSWQLFRAMRYNLLSSVCRDPYHLFSPKLYVRILFLELPFVISTMTFSSKLLTLSQML